MIYSFRIFSSYLILFCYVYIIVGLYYKCGFPLFATLKGSFNMMSFIFYFKLWEMHFFKYFLSIIISFMGPLLSKTFHYFFFHSLSLTFIISLSFLPSGNFLYAIFWFINSLLAVFILPFIPVEFFISAIIFFLPNISA